MKRGLLAFLLAAGLLAAGCAVAAPAAAQQLGMVTGGPKGTYIQIGNNIRDLVAPQGIKLDVRTSAGSIENILAVRHTPGVQMGIVQQDVLAFVKRQAKEKPETSADMLDLVAKVRLIFPLYNEEVHILANDGVRRLEDLNGKRVAIGPKNSGTFLTSVVLFDKTGISPAQTFAYKAVEAVEALRKGEIDAMVYVAGYPASVFTNNVTADDRLHLVPIPVADYSLLTDTYTFSSIPKWTYPWQDADVETAAVKAVLVSYNYRGDNCGAVGKLARLVYTGIDELRRTGHPKWNALDLDTPLESWEPYDCVQDALEGVRHGPAAATGGKLPDILKQIGD
ncbi:MAG: TAXI family TRAP transporter solute-binding subunit [Hyphomicrobiales bacterium]|nr:TAXI family TRAP transporter solute-binding subunit [Hyphomicrobiales bacterium]MCP5372566.1 TAXI family TRAP transporter solute-binding subunit [Hyphomicrobiales bacterium]